MIELSGTWFLYFYGLQDTYHKATYIFWWVGVLLAGDGEGVGSLQPALLGPSLQQLGGIIKGKFLSAHISFRCISMDFCWPNPLQLTFCSFLGGKVVIWV